mgnify:CR=1 FL=1
MTSDHPLRNTLLGAATFLCGASLTAGDYEKAIIDDKAPIASWEFCDLFKNNTLYKGDGFIRSIKFKGRYHGHYVSSSDDHLLGNPAPNSNVPSDFWEHRRWRSGLEFGLAHDLKLTSSFNHDVTRNFNGPHFVDNLDELHIQWSPSDDFWIRVGKQKLLITREYEESSNRILTPERSTIVNNVAPPGKLWGIAVGFEAAGFEHRASLFGVGYDNDFYWPAFEGAGAVFTYSLSRELTENTEVFFDYMYSDTDASPATGFTERYDASAYEHVVALGTESKWGRFGLITDVILASDRRDRTLDDTWGLVILPYYDITDKLQLVARYSYAEDARLARPQQHASQPYVDGLSTFFVGFNYYICGHNLKLTGGYEYATGDQFANNTSNDYQNDSWILGVRTSW